MDTQYDILERMKLRILLYYYAMVGEVAICSTWSLHYASYVRLDRPVSFQTR